jgi:hypothetical protein
MYLPAVISPDERPPSGRGVHAVLSIPLADGEANEFFAPGKGFTIWANALIGHTVCGDGLVGYGVISPDEPRSVPRSAGRDLQGAARSDFRFHHVPGQGGREDADR